MLNKAFVVGLTGPIGSGKTIVAAQFVDNGYKLIDADELAKRIVQKGSKTLGLLADAFGNVIIKADGTLDRKKLSKIAFSSRENTDMLNSITHPAILELVECETQRFVSLGYTKIIYDAPLLFESGSDRFCDRIVTVVADVDKRVQRVKRRDNMSEQDIKNRISSQHENSYYTDKSDYVIYNNFSLDKLLNDTMDVISKLNEVHDVTLCENR